MAQISLGAFLKPSTQWWRNCASLDLDFMNNRYYINSNTTCDGTTGTVYSGISSFVSGVGATFSRASTASYYNSSGTLSTASSGTPRLDYDPLTLSPMGVLIEASATNLVVNSQSFSGTAASVVSAAATSPDGTTNASKIVEDTTTARHYAYPSGGVGTVTANTAYTYSVYMKAAGRSYGYIMGGKSGSPYTRGGAVVDLSTGSTSSYNVASPSSVVIRTPKLLANGWVRVAVTVVIDASSTDAWIEFGPCSGSTSSTCSYTGDGSSGIYVWGAQVESGAVPTSYIPTSGATATRAADSFSLATTAGGGWYTSGTGTFITESSIPWVVDSTSGVVNRIFSLYASGGNTLGQSVTQASRRSFVTSGGTTVLSYDVGTATADALTRSAFTFNSGSIPYAGFSGTAGTTGAAVTIPSLTTLYLGSQNSNYFLNGYVRRLSYIPTYVASDAVADYSR